MFECVLTPPIHLSLVCMKNRRQLHVSKITRFFLRDKRLATELADTSYNSLNITYSFYRILCSLLTNDGRLYHNLLLYSRPPRKSTFIFVVRSASSHFYWASYIQSASSVSQNILFLNTWVLDTLRNSRDSWK